MAWSENDEEELVVVDAFVLGLCAADPLLFKAEPKVTRSSAAIKFTINCFSLIILLKELFIAL